MRTNWNKGINLYIVLDSILTFMFWGLVIISGIKSELVILITFELVALVQTFVWANTLFNEEWLN